MAMGTFNKKIFSSALQPPSVWTWQINNNVTCMTVGKGHFSKNNSFHFIVCGTCTHSCKIWCMAYVPRVSGSISTAWLVFPWHCTTDSPLLHGCHTPQCIPRPGKCTYLWVMITYLIPLDRGMNSLLKHANYTIAWQWEHLTKKYFLLLYNRHQCELGK